MTNEQKAAIIEFRKNGCGYRTIAQHMGMNDNTIKAFCKRNGLGGVAAAAQTVDPDLLCKCCGKRLVKIPGRKPRKFCSDSCRTHWWNSHLDLVNRKANYTFICKNCGQPFTAYGDSHRKYCCHACYINDRFGVRKLG